MRVPLFPLPSFPCQSPWLVACRLAAAPTRAVQSCLAAGQGERHPPFDASLLGLACRLLPCRILLAYQALRACQKTGWAPATALLCSNYLGCVPLAQVEPDENTQGQAAQITALALCATLAGNLCDRLFALTRRPSDKSQSAALRLPLRCHPTDTTGKPLKQCSLSLH